MYKLFMAIVFLGFGTAIAAADGDTLGDAHYQVWKQQYDHTAPTPRIDIVVPRY